MLRRWLNQQRLGLGVGAAITLAAVVLHAVGWTAPLEWAMYDVLVRHCSRVPASPDILHVDLDDAALTSIGSWPWPRDLDGRVVQILHELGASRIVLDFLWTEPKAGPEFRSPAQDPYAEFEGDIKQIGEVSPENFVYPDDELAAAVRESGPVYLAFFYETTAGSGAAGSLPASADPVSRATGSLPASADLSVRMADLLRRDFSLTGSMLADRLSVPPANVDSLLPRIKRSVARELVAARLSAAAPASQPSARQVYEALLKTPFDRLTADRKDILTAYDRELGSRSLQRRCIPVPTGLKGKLPTVADVLPPLHKLTSMPAGDEATIRQIRPGFANWRADDSGTLRTIPLVREWNGHLIEQLGFAAACDTLGVQPEDLSIDERHNLRIASRGSDPPMRIQLDEHGQMLVNWHVAQSSRWQDCFRHVPITQILRINEARERMRQNHALRDARMDQVIRTVKNDTAYARYRAQIAQMLELRGRGRPPTGKPTDSNPWALEAEQIREKLDQERVLAADLVRQTWAQLMNEPNPADPAIADDYRRFREANAILTEVIPEIDATNAKIAVEEKQLLRQLRPLIEGKVCFVGYTATAVADMVHSPAYEQVPGVLIHSQVFNSLMQHRFRSWAGQPTQLLVVLAFGLAVTLIAARWGPRTSLTIVLALMAGTLALNALWLFATRDYWLPMLTAVVSGCVAWAMVVMVRYLVTDRQRRWFSRALARYVSPAMARQIGESASNLSFAPVDAVVTCFFSDLAGFTALSEALGPQGTRAVLNPYLQAMSGVLHRHQALINKFMGDGIFAFFNPPILPCPDHAIAACEAALECQQALADLIARHAGTPWATQFGQLAMRIGIATGPVFVGDYGSEDKLDYTCMGDVVNLAARLESANKQFDTAIMVAGPTREATADRFAFRRLGLLQVKGQTRSVAVYELLGRRDEVDDGVHTYAELFDQAVLAFSRRHWSVARAGFETCTHHRQTDRAARRYLDLIHQYQTAPPADDWQGTLELTEK